MLVKQESAIIKENRASTHCKYFKQNRWLKNQT